MVARWTSTRSVFVTDPLTIPEGDKCLWSYQTAFWNVHMPWFPLHHVDIVSTTLRYTKQIIPRERESKIASNILKAECGTDDSANDEWVIFIM